jgi:hypothetical protein
VPLFQELARNTTPKQEVRVVIALAMSMADFHAGKRVKFKEALTALVGGTGASHVAEVWT